MSDDTIVQQILVALARIEERIKAQAEQSEHRHANLKMVVEGFVPRRELEKTFESLDDRISDLEDSRRKLVGWVFGAWAAGLATVGSLLLKKL